MARQDRTLKKVNKVLARVEKHIEETRDALEDLEIEFEVPKATVKRLKTASVESQEPVEETDEDMDIENPNTMQNMMTGLPESMGWAVKLSKDSP